MKETKKFTIFEVVNFSDSTDTNKAFTNTQIPEAVNKLNEQISSYDIVTKYDFYSEIGLINKEG